VQHSGNHQFTRASADRFHHFVLKNDSNGKKTTATAQMKKNVGNLKKNDGNGKKRRQRHK